MPIVPLADTLRQFPVSNEALHEADCLWASAQWLEDELKIRSKPVAIWSLIASMLILTSAFPSAYGLEFPMTTQIEIDLDEQSLTAQELPIQSAAALYGSIELAATPLGAIFSSDIALVSSITMQVEMARTPFGARKVAKAILAQEFGFKESEFSCLNSLWTKESNWNYKARNRNSGAHGIPQALPADKMSVVGTDWRTNPVTQIRWGLRYITIRYDTPCKAWSFFKSKRYY